MLNQKMQDMFDEGKYEELIDYIENFETPNIEILIEGLIHKSRIMAFLDKWENGLELADQAIELSKKNQLELMEIESLIAKGYNCSRAHHTLLTSTLSLIEFQIDIVGESLDKTTKEKIMGDMYFLKGWFHFTKQQTELGRKELEKSLTIRRAHGELQPLIEILLYFGFTYLENQSGSSEKWAIYIEEALTLAKQLGNKHFLGLAYNWCATGVGFHRDARDGLKLFQEGITIYKELGGMGEGKLSRLYNNISLIHRDLEEFESTLSYQKLYLDLATKNNDIASLALGNSNISYTYVQMRRFEEAIQFRKESLLHAYKMNNQGSIAQYHNALGLIYYSKGELNFAEKEFLLALKLREELGSMFLIALTKSFLLALYTARMETEKAFKIILEIRLILDDFPDDNGEGWIYVFEGMNYRTIERGEQALSSYDNAEKCWDKIPDVGDIKQITRRSYVLLQKILLMTEIGDKVNAEKNFDELNLITRDVKSSLIKLRNKFLQALILKTKARGASKFQAQSIFKEIISSELTDIQIYSLSMLNYCDLLILEMKITETPEIIIQEITNVVLQMINMGKSQKIPMFLVMGELIHGKIDLVNDDLRSARICFQKAKTIAEEHNLQSLISKVEIEQNFVEEEISKWNEKTSEDLPITERVEKAQIHEYLIHAISVKEKMVTTSSISIRDS